MRIISQNATSGTLVLHDQREQVSELSIPADMIENYCTNLGKLPSCLASCQLKVQQQRVLVGSSYNINTKSWVPHLNQTCDIT